MRKGALSIKSVWRCAPSFAGMFPAGNPKCLFQYTLTSSAPHVGLWLSEMVGVLYVRVSERVNAKQAMLD